VLAGCGPAGSYEYEYESAHGYANGSENDGAGVDLGKIRQRS